MLIKANVMNGANVVRAVECEANIPATLEDMRKAWGDDVVRSLAEDSAVIMVQALMRGYAKATKKRGAMTNAAIAEKISAWKPEPRNMAKNPQEKAKKMVEKLGDDARKALLEELLASQGKPALRKKSA
jgi:hypothetical protein